MTTIAFDTHAYVKKLKAVGFTEEQAEVQAEALRESQESGVEDLATKADLKLEISRLEGEIKLIKWMIGVMLAGVISLVLKAFFM